MCSENISLQLFNIPTFFLKIFVCGGEDLKLYKYDYETGIEIGEF